MVSRMRGRVSRTRVEDAGSVDALIVHGDKQVSGLLETMESVGADLRDRAAAEISPDAADRSAYAAI